MNTTRCDLHLHSSASVGNEWYTRFFGCPESYVEPLRQYELCKARGMSLVTLTDHDTIAGGLTLTGRADFFLSEEITAVFPDSGCVMHVLAWNITPVQHDEIQATRQDIYGLCEYLNREGIAHGLAHPLLSPNWKLDADVFEKVLLLFPTLEGINGLTDKRIEPDLATLLDRLTPAVIAALSLKHGIAPAGAAPHRKALTAGSDDHVNRRAGTVCTEIAGAALGPVAFIARCMAGEARLVGTQAHLDAMAMSVKHTTYHHFKQRQQESADYRSPFVDLMDVIAGRDSAPDGDVGTTAGAAAFVASLLTGAERAALDIGKPFDILQPPESLSEKDDARIIEGVARLSDKVLERALQDLLAAAQDFDLYRVFGGFRDLAGGLVTAAPLFFAADHFGKQDQGVRRLWEAWSAYALPLRPERVGLFTDCVEARFLARPGADGREVLVPTCGELPAHVEDSAGFHSLAALTAFALPFNTRVKVHVPSPVGALQWVWRERVSHVELATPGPMGLAGLLAAKVLRLPVTASYHAEIQALIGSLGGNAMMERAAHRYLAWFYARVDRVLAFSTGARAALCELGVPAAKIEVVSVSVDPDDFPPARSDATVLRQ